MSKAFPWREAPEATFAVLGDRVQHSLSPQMHHAAYDALKLSHRYVPILVNAGEFAPAADHLCSLGYVGANVTAPLKEEAYAWSSRLMDDSEKIGAVNTVRFENKSAINTDGPGFLAAFRIQAPEARRVLLLGAGGAAKATAWALTDAGYDLTIWNRTAEKAESLAKSVGARVISGFQDLEDFDAVVNATRSDPGSDHFDFPFFNLTRRCICVDLSYGLAGTPFSTSASDAGLRSHDGKLMLAEQGAIGFSWWLGFQAPFEIMRAAVAAGHTS